MRVCLIMVAMGGLLSACGSGIRSVAGTPQGVTIRYEGANLEAATKRADSYCRALDRRAGLQSVIGDGSENVAVFYCA